MSGLFQALLGQAAKLPQPRLNKRKQAFCLIDVDSVRRYTDECDADGDAGHRTEVDEANNDNETNEADEASEADDRIAREWLIQRFTLWFTNRRMGSTPTAPEAAQALESVARFAQPDSGLDRELQNRCWSGTDDEASETRELDE